MKLKMLNISVKFSFGAFLAMVMLAPASHAAMPGSGTACDAANPIVKVSSEGAGISVPTTNTLTVTLIGPITNANRLKRGGKQNIRVCEGALVDYHAESTAGAATCTLNKRPVPAQGQIKANSGAQRLQCTDKPDGSDTDQFRIVGVNR